jgi:methyl-accepting chemotaxis protein
MTDTSDPFHDDARRAEFARHASTLAERARERLGATIEPIKDKAKEIAETQKHNSAEKIGGVAAAVRHAAEDLDQHLPRAAGYIHQAADSMERASASLKEQSVDELIGGLGRFARNQPAAFFGAAVLAGFALSRFVKSSVEQISR